MFLLFVAVFKIKFRFLLFLPSRLLPSWIEPVTCDQALLSLVEKRAFFSLPALSLLFYFSVGKRMPDRRLGLRRRVYLVQLVCVICARIRNFV